MLGLIVGLVIGLAWDDFPYFVIEKDVSITSALGIMITIFIGVFYPFLIKKWIDDNRPVKAHLVKEVFELDRLVEKNRNLVKSCFDSKNIDQDDRDKLRFNIHKAELQYQSIEEQFKISFPKRIDIPRQIWSAQQA